MNWHRMLAILRKEVAHILRDPFTLALALGLPVFMVMFFGIAMEFNVKAVPMSYLDSDKSPSSRLLLETFGSSNYFHLLPVDSPLAGVTSVQAERARAFMVIPPDFQKNLLSGRGTEIQILLDGADNSTVGAVSDYIARIQKRAIPRLLSAGAQDAGKSPTGAQDAGKSAMTPSEPIELRSRYLFNPELNSKWFVVPGLVVVVMSILSILLTALTVAREWENGSMELLLSTPVQPSEIIIGKLAPYAGLGLGAVALVYVLARTVFGVPFNGSHFVFLFGCLLFLITYLAQGLLISVTVRKQQVAMQLAMMTGLLPSQLLSGFIFPVESMPTFFRYFTMILPARWFMNISRDIFLQGSGFWQLKWNFLALAIIGSVMLTISVRKFKKDVEP